MTKEKPTEEPVVCDICGQIVDEKPDRYNFAVLGDELPLNGHPTCIKNVKDKIMGPNRTALEEWDRSRERTIQRQTLDLVIPLIQVRLEGDLRNLHTELLEPLIEQEKREQQLRQERQASGRFKKSRKIWIERKTPGETLLEKLRAQRKRQLKQEK